MPLPSRAATPLTSLNAEGGNGSSQLSFLASLTNESNVYEYNSPDHYSGSTFSLETTYQLNNTYSFAVTLSGTQEHTHGHTASFHNTPLTLRRSPWTLTNNLSLTTSLSAVAPTDVMDRKLRSFLGAILMSTNLAQSTQIFSTPLTINYSLRLQRNFHEFTRTSSDSANIIHNGSLAISSSQSIINKLSFALSFAGSAAQTYQGTFLNYFTATQSFIYELNTQSTLNIGHSNSADIFKPDGKSSNIDLFNESSSRYFASLSYQF